MSNYGLRESRLLLIILLLLGAESPCRAETLEEIYQAALTSFALPLRDLMEKEHPSEWENLFSGLSGNIALSYPLKDTIREGRGVDGAQTQDGFRKSTLSATFKYNPVSYWFAAITVNGYLDLGRGKPMVSRLPGALGPGFFIQFRL